MRRNIFYINRIIKIISPLTFQTFKVELNGEENELRELLATILEIDPNSIKGLRDSYNNYYTLSSAVNNPDINTNPYNYYTVVIKDSLANIGRNNKKPLIIEDPSYNYKVLKDGRIRTLPNENNINYHTNFLNNTYNFYEDNNFSHRNINMNDLNYCNNNIVSNHDINEYLNFADDLYKKKYIDYDLNKKLKKLIIDDNNEVLTIMSPYINIKSQKSYDEFAQKIIPIISARTANIKDSSSSSDSENNKKITKIFKNEDILENIKNNISKSVYSKLKKLLKDKKKNKKILELIKSFKKNNDFNKFLSKLKKLINSEEEDNSSNNIKDDESGKSKNKNDFNEKDIKKVIKLITNTLKKKANFDIYYIARYDFQQLNKEEKISLLTKKFKLPIESIINDDNYKLPDKYVDSIINYYTKYIEKKIKKNLDENENVIYESLIEQKEENNVLLQYFKDLLKHKKLNELKKEIKQITKETIEKIQKGEGEEEEEDDEEEDENDDERKSLIKEEENEEDEEEEEEDDEEGEEEEDEKDSKNEDNKSSSNKSSDNIIILKDDNKDRAANMLNNNYRKINNYNYKNENSNNDNNKDKKDEQNLGLGFVVIKQKKSTKNGFPDDGKITTETKQNDQNESSLSTNNPNKKLNQFIQQIEHMKKIDDIKKPILEAINDNNKYIMDLFQKFQKNKLSLNPKSLLACYKTIKENPDTNSKGALFKSLVKDVPNVSDNIKEFLYYEFINKNSELETYFNLYENDKEKDDFIESIELFLKKASAKQLLEKYNSNQFKKEIETILSQKKKNDNLETKSLEIVKILEKFNLFKENELNQIKNSLKNNDNVFSSIFEILFKDKDYDEFYENISIALAKNQSNKGGNKK